LHNLNGDPRKVRNRLPRGAELAETTDCSSRAARVVIRIPLRGCVDCYLDQVTGFVNRLLRLPGPAAVVVRGGSRRPTLAEKEWTIFLKKAYDDYGGLIKEPGIRI